MMPGATDFPELIRKARAGDEAASAELVRLLEPFVQRVVRIRMRQRPDHDRLRQAVGFSDVCQSVFRSFFHGLREGRYALEQLDDLQRLLQVMIRFNVATKARRSGIKLRELIADFELAGWVRSGPGPDQEVADHDLAEAIQQRFSEEELEIVAMWLDDVPWPTIGERLGCTGDAARMRLQRALARVKERMDAGNRTKS